MKAEQATHRPLCTIELIAEGHATRCTGAACAFWDEGCVLARVEAARRQASVAVLDADVALSDLDCAFAE